MDPATIVEIAEGLIQMVIKLVGPSKASDIVSQQVKIAANAAADAIDEARGLK